MVDKVLAGGEGGGPEDERHALARRAVHLVCRLQQQRVGIGKIGTIAKNVIQFGIPDPSCWIIYPLFKLPTKILYKVFITLE